MAFPIPRASHVLVLVLMVYVTVLNSAIVNILYRTYVLPAIKARDSRQARATMARGFAHHPPQTPAAAMPTPESACSSNLAVAVYVGLAAKYTSSNDVPHTSLLVRMRSARVPPNTRIFVIMSPESFQPLHELPATHGHGICFGGYVNAFMRLSALLHDLVVVLDHEIQLVSICYLNLPQ